MIGSRQAILWEGKPTRMQTGEYRFFGHTENYHKVYLDSSEHTDIANSVLECEINGYDEEVGALVARSLDPVAAVEDRLIVKQI